MFSLFRKMKDNSIIELVPQEVALINIKSIDKEEILYNDNNGQLMKINFKEAYKGWCKNKNSKKSRVKYVCDRTKSDGWKMIFYTKPKVTFLASAEDETLWRETINQIKHCGYATFDWD